MKCELSEVRPKAILHIFFELCWCLCSEAQPSSCVLPCQQNWLDELTSVHLICKFLLFHISLCHSVVTMMQGPEAQGLEWWVLKWAHIVSCSALQREAPTHVRQHVHKNVKGCLKDTAKPTQTEWHEENNDITVIYDFTILGREWYRILHFWSPPVTLTTLPSYLYHETQLPKGEMISLGTHSRHSVCIPTQSITLLASSFRDFSATQKSVHLQRSMHCKGGRLNSSSYLSRWVPEAQIFRLVLEPPSCATSMAGETHQTSVGFRCQGTVMLNKHSAASCSLVQIPTAGMGQ